MSSLPWSTKDQANGHLICYHCKPSLTINLPDFEIEYTGQPIRSIIAEKIWDICVLLKCRFEGCNFKAAKAKIKEHEVKLMGSNKGLIFIFFNFFIK
jgi:hypothetical protein